MSINLGIDASNIRQGGGVTHLVRLLASVDTASHDIERVTVWSCPSTLASLPNDSWLEKRTCSELEPGLLRRVLWQNLSLPSELIAAGCHVLFSPGGTLPWKSPVPTVTMSQNMLPFEPAEAKLFGALHPMRLKMFLLRISQGRSFQAADGVIFLSEYARTRLSSLLKLDPKRTILIAHGVEPRFFRDSRPARTTAGCSASDPYRLLYVSILMPYKHQIEVAEAVARLRTDGLFVEMSFIGPTWGWYGKAVQMTCRRLDPDGTFLHLTDAVAFGEMHTRYTEADAFVFASSCENLPNILIEAMAAGLPIACADRGPMREILGDAGEYFDPESPESIEVAIRALAESESRRVELAAQAAQRARSYSWDRCASETFAFIARVAGARCT